MRIVQILTALTFSSISHSILFSGVRAQNTKAAAAKYCIGYSEIYGGNEGAQVSDDGHVALYFK